MPRFAVLLAIALSATACGNGGGAGTTSGGAASTDPAPATSAQAPATTADPTPTATDPAPATTADAPTGTAAAPPITTTGDTPVPDEQKKVVLAWSAAINRNDNNAAAELFAKDAIVAQSAVFKLIDKPTAVLWNDGLPCAGKVVELRMVQNAVVATFVLGERPKHRCDAPGHRAGAAFVIEGGKITLWEQVPVPDADPGTPTATAPTASGPVA
jgi:limonene-1,2-epoxide hydrolase